MSLNAAQRAFMREWLERCIARLESQPPSAHRNQSIAVLQESLERYQEPSLRPVLTLIEGGRACG